MSGYVPLLLQTTPSPQPATEVISAVVRRLGENARYRLFYRFPERVLKIVPGYTLDHYRLQPIGARWNTLYEAAHATGWMWINAQIDIGAITAGITIRSQPLASYDPRPVVLLELDGCVYDSVYPDMSNRRSFSASQKQALLRLCLDLAGATGAAGFVLSQSNRPLPGLDDAELHEAPALIKGIALGLAKAPSQPTRHRYVAQNAWVVDDYFLP